MIDQGKNMQKNQRKNYRVKFTDPALPDNDYIVFYRTEEEAQMVVDKTNHARNQRIRENLVALHILQNNGSTDFDIDETASKTAGLYAIYIGVERKKSDNPKTHCKRGHRFTEKNTYRSPSRPDYRICKTCMEKSARARHGGIFR
jgi:hypothetical protein